MQLHIRRTGEPRSRILGFPVTLCANNGETGTPSTITVGQRRKSDLGKPIGSSSARFFLRGAAPTAPRPPAPDSEVTARPVRRLFTAEYKRSILDQAAAAHNSGAIGALLRREGLYSSHLTTWKRQRAQGELDALTPKKRGPKATVSPLTKEMLHYGLAGQVIEQRQQVLDNAFARHPERFVQSSPIHPPQPTAVWINPPTPTPSKEDLRL